MFRDIEYIVNLVYIDETLSDNKDLPYVIVGALVVPHEKFIPLEGIVEQAAMVALTMEPGPTDEAKQQAARDKWDSIEEFHACELFHAQGAFTGIDRNRCLTAMDALIRSVPHFGLTFVYSAVSRSAIKTMPMTGNSANPIDVAFQMCVRGVEDLIGSQIPLPPVVKAANRIRAYGISRPENICVVVMDETKDGKLKSQLKDSYKAFRHKRPWKVREPHNRGWHFHDAMFFADSKDSFGIQVADACAYVTLRHVTKMKDQDSIKLFTKLQPNLICSKSEPEWSTYRHFFIEHDAPSGAQPSGPVTSSEPQAPSSGQA